ncbi:hypothetical protein L596_025949 [Steinernema carpocapsae]|uniref:Uncharacterized protein n=1 Tax=Steinernema carpocapsae TaxID=34508 RepID=A0A4U5M9C6_STECR|nr:hypothetical protein L596_025949 [Steinernema carpocapsae]
MSFMSHFSDYDEYDNGDDQYTPQVVIQTQPNFEPQRLQRHDSDEEELFQRGRGSRKFHNKEKQRRTDDIKYYTAKKKDNYRAISTKLRRDAEIRYCLSRINLSNHTISMNEDLVQDSEDQKFDPTHKNEAFEKKRRERKRRRRLSEPSDHTDTELWTFYNSSLHQDSRDYIVFCAQPDHNNLDFGHIPRQFQANYSLSLPKTILGADKKTLKLFGWLKDNDLCSKRPKLKAEKAKILYPAVEIPKEMPVLASKVALIEPRVVEIKERETLEETLKRKLQISRAQPSNIKIRSEIIDLTDKLAKQKACYVTAHERNQFLKTHKVQMLDLWRKFAQDFDHNLDAVKGYISQWLSVCEQPEKVVEYVAQKTETFKQNVDFWRFVARDVYSKVARNVSEYVYLIDQVIDQFKMAETMGEKFLAELFLLRTRVYFESGDIPTVIATIQLLVELFSTPVEVALKEKLATNPDLIHGTLCVFWNTGYRRLADVDKTKIRTIFPDCDIGFQQFLKNYLENYRGNANVFNEQLTNQEAAQRYLKGINDDVLESTHNLVKTFPGNCSEADLWLNLEATRQKHLWFPIAAYAGVQLNELLQKALVPYEKLSKVVHIFDDKTIGVKLILNLLSLFGVSVPSSFTNEDNVLSKFGFLKPPMLKSDLQNFDSWSQDLLKTLADLRSGGSSDYKYTYAMMITEKLTSFNQLNHFLGQVSSLDKDIYADVVFNSVIHQMASIPNSPAFTSKKTQTYKVLSQLYQKLDSGLTCFDDKGNVASIYALRVLAQLLAFCPNDQKSYKQYQTTRGELYKKVLGPDVMTKLYAGFEKPATNKMAQELERLFQLAFKVPKTDHFCGYAATYIAFYRAAIEYHGKSLAAFLSMVKKLGDQYPQFCLNEQWCVLVMQFLWNREKTADEFEKEKKMTQEEKLQKRDQEQKELESKMKLNRHFLDLHPTSVELMKLLANHFYVEQNQMRLRVMFKEENKNSLADLVGSCANIYLSNLRAKASSLNVSQLPSQRNLTRDQLIKANSATCTISSSLARTWIHFEKSVFGNVFSEAVLKDIQNWNSQKHS